MLLKPLEGNITFAKSKYIKDPVCAILDLREFNVLLLILDHRVGRKTNAQLAAEL